MKKWNWDLIGAVGWGLFWGLVLLGLIRSSYAAFGNDICESLSTNDIPANIATDIAWKCESTVRRILANGDTPMLFLLWATSSWAIWKLSQRINRGS